MINYNVYVAKVQKKLSICAKIILNILEFMQII